MGLLGLYALAHFAFSILAAFVIKLSSATALNLSTLSADFYALIMGIQLFQFKVCSDIHFTCILAQIS
jgi:hypothetical protein